MILRVLTMYFSAGMVQYNCIAYMLNCQYSDQIFGEELRQYPTGASLECFLARNPYPRLQRNTSAR
jgi:hypothetical protein